MYRNGIKRLLSVVLSLCGMICLSWLFLILAVAIKLDSPGPVFFKQKRVGIGKKHFYSSDAAVIAAGYERLRVICGTYLLCGIMDTLASSLRGLGYSVLPMVVSLVGSCLLRLVWIATIFQLNRTPFMLYISYPISWVLTAAVHLACLLVVRHKMRQRGQTLQAA